MRLQEDYDPDGWLGIMIGTKLWVDFSISETLDESRKKLKQLLGDRGRICEENQPDNGKVIPQTTIQNYKASFGRPWVDKPWSMAGVHWNIIV